METITTILGNWKIAAIAILFAIVVGLGGGLYIHHLNGRIDSVEQARAVAEASLNQQIEVNTQNSKTLVQMQKEQSNAITALGQDSINSVLRAETFTKLKEDIANEKQSKDGPIAPVLANTLNSLRRGTSKTNPSNSVHPSKTGNSKTIA